MAIASKVISHGLHFLEQIPGPLLPGLNLEACGRDSQKHPTRGKQTLVHDLFPCVTCRQIRFAPDSAQGPPHHAHLNLRRGDAWWGLFAELAAALLWLHPLAWLALPRLRLDQELTCDEQVLRQSPQDAIPYARTLLHGRCLADSTAALIPWLAEPQLKERLSMIGRQRHGVLRRRIGFIALAALMAGSALLAQPATPARSSQQASADLDYNSQRQPRYPQDAIMNRQQGTVVLRVLVAADGTPARIEMEPGTHAAPSRVKAASEAAAQWRFNPALEAGKPIASHAGSCCNSVWIRCRRHRRALRPVPENFHPSY